ncbi:MAG TPA: hypothetical protein VK809_06145 [Bacteroidia bacterium]|jgi:hypothetical protein|nr:hypothetical protein [Bacteroidia bacterium]
MEETELTPAPTSEVIVAPPIPEGKVYKANVIRGATFFGGPLVAGYMVASNFKALGDIDKIKWAWFWSILTSILIICFIFLVPDKIQDKVPNIVFPFFYSLITFGLVKHYQEAKIMAHLNSGGKSFKWGKSLVVSIIGAVTILIPILMSAVMAEPPTKYDSVKTYALDTVKNQLYYNSSNISEKELDQVGAAAIEAGYFTNKKPLALCVNKDKAVFEITAIFDGMQKNNPELIPFYTDLQKQLQTFLPHHKVVLILCCDDLDHFYKRIE